MENIPDCPVCAEKFDLEDHAPYITQCAHTICSSCLKSLTSNGIYKCCECNTM